MIYCKPACQVTQIFLEVRKRQFEVVECQIEFLLNLTTSFSLLFSLLFSLFPTDV